MTPAPPRSFQCSSASRKFLNSIVVTPPSVRHPVSVLFSEPKIPQFPEAESVESFFIGVSVLFSEPKIPQYYGDHRLPRSSVVSVLFSEPKIPQCNAGDAFISVNVSFSALQRAENSSMGWTNNKTWFVPKFQCSSASRKFLNQFAEGPDRRSIGFQCSSASRKFLNLPGTPGAGARVLGVSVLFSEPKIPQCSSRNTRTPIRTCVSVLFSEPKIPQFLYVTGV